MSRSLPASLDAVTGLRAARWFRESTSGQFDNFGPDAQREQQDRAIERYGLLDAGLEWSVASSGWTSAWRTPTWEAMVASAQAGAFDVLVVGYVSRFLRNLKQTLIAVEDHLHAAGVVVLFADERLLSSDPSNWDQFVREAHEAEAYSRKLSKRVHEGYAAKRRRLGVPGGNRAPFGIIREGKPSTLRIDEAKVATVRRAYELAAVGQTDWEVAAATDLAKTHVGELLTNPMYAGRLRTGEPAGIAPIVEPALWSKVQSMRELRRTRTPGRIVKRNYPLRLRCSGCQRFLYGDVGRYRHPAPTCDAFIAGTPGARRRYTKGDDKRAGGHSYPQAWYEDAIGLLLSEVGSVDDVTITEVVRRYHDRPTRVDDAALARISREREEASRRLSKSRDVMAWQREMAQLDAEEQAARDPVERGRLTSSEVVAYLRSLPSLWADSGPDGRQALATALFARTDVLGFERMEYELTPDAIELGLGAALPAVFEIGKEREFGRGERTRPDGTYLIPRSPRAVTDPTDATRACGPYWRAYGHRSPSARCPGTNAARGPSLWKGSLADSAWRNRRLPTRQHPRVERMGLLDRLLGRTPTPPPEPTPATPPAQMPAREPYRDPIDLQIDELTMTHVHAAERLRGVREQGRQFFLDTDVWLAADAIWTIVQAAWPDDQADAFFAARDEAERRLDAGAAELRVVAEAVVREISDLASTAIQGSAMLGSSHLDDDDQNRADDRAMWQAGGAHHVVNAAVLAYVLGEQLDEAATSLLKLPWLALCETSEEDRYGLIAAAEENTLDAFRALADDRVLFREPDQPRTALVQLLEPIDDDAAADEGGESADDDASFDDEEMESLFGER